MSFRSFLVSRLCQYWNNPSLYGTLDGVVTRSPRHRQSKQFLIVHGGHGGTRRGSNCFHPRRGAKNTLLSTEDAEGRGEHLTAFIREVTRRVAKNTILSAEDAEERGEHLTAFIREVTRRVAKNTILSTEDAEGRGERQHLYPRRAAKDAGGEIFQGDVRRHAVVGARAGYGARGTR